MEVSIGVLGLDFSKVKQTTDQVYIGERSSSSANFKINLFSIGLGIGSIYKKGKMTRLFYICILVLLAGVQSLYAQQRDTIIIRDTVFLDKEEFERKKDIVEGNTNLIHIKPHREI